MNWKTALLLLLVLSIVFISLGCGDDDDDDDSGSPADDDDDDNDDNDDDNNDDDNDDDTVWPTPLDDGSFEDDDTPFVSELDDRISDFLADCAAVAVTSGGLHTQICSLATDAGPVREDPISGAIAKMDARLDCADFRLVSLTRIIAKYADSPNLTQDQYDRIITSIQNFKYWIDEPGEDGMCFFTENHFILFNSSAFILGDLFPTMVFTNSGLTGTQLRAKARYNIDRWLDFRLRFGFTEFHSDVYYNEDLPALVNLSDFGNDNDIQVRSRMVIDLFLLDMAQNNHEGLFGMPHGRSYMKDKQKLEKEDTKSTIWLMYGKGAHFDNFDNMSAVALADSHTYRLPAVIESIGSSRPRGLESREKLSINFDDGPSLGYPHDDFDAGLQYWTMLGAFVMPQTTELSFAMAEAWNLLNPESMFAAVSFLKPLNDLGILDDIIYKLYPLVTGNGLEQVNTYVYRTPEVMLASAQDYRPAHLGMQTHNWQASLGWDALVFTTYPGGLVNDSAAGEWTGGWNPRVAQKRTAAIILYQKPTVELSIGQWIIDKLLPSYTHAYFPKAAFDEIVENGSWTFGRFGEGYVALYSENDTYWVTEGEWADKELRTDGAKNVWICEVGDSTLYDSFEQFMSLVIAAPLDISEDQTVIYDSPGQGRLEFAWEGDFYVNGEQFALEDYKRFDNPYIEKEFDQSDDYLVQRGSLSLRIDVDGLVREVVE